ncbi:hypothetical protein [Bradyrhizobium liaoningense]|uniref:hypothetical protein n=1 Tax=Bradyrhizobium liaoningense TaxID=43992 RepID=UPI001BA4B85B|nr:hypothetical protein [Bradyrhizobium liaoningense]MBR0709414.1 hypothetical protein [Bradyrhizobium liaoningense]
MTKIKMAETAANRIRHIGVLLSYSLGECSPVLQLGWKGTGTKVDYNFSFPNDDPIIPLGVRSEFPEICYLIVSSALALDICVAGK